MINKNISYMENFATYLGFAPKPLNSAVHMRLTAHDADSRAPKSVR